MVTAVAFLSKGREFDKKFSFYNSTFTSRYCVKKKSTLILDDGRPVHTDYYDRVNGKSSNISEK